MLCYAILLGLWYVSRYMWLWRVCNETLYIFYRTERNARILFDSCSLDYLFLECLQKIINFRQKKSRHSPLRKSNRRIVRVRQRVGAKRRHGWWWASALIRGRADANDVSPSGKLMLKYEPEWTIRGVQAGPTKRKLARCLKAELRGGPGRGKKKGERDEIVKGPINESSGKIVRWREYRRGKLNKELKGWVMKGNRRRKLVKRLGNDCERKFAESLRFDRE